MFFISHYFFRPVVLFEYQSEFIAGSATNPANADAPEPPGPTMGPKADPNVTYKAYLAKGWTDEVMRANGIII